VKNCSLIFLLIDTERVRVQLKGNPLTRVLVATFLIDTERVQLNRESPRMRFTVTRITIT
jgi:hypothetical protein